MEKKWFTAREVGEIFSIPAKTMLSLAARGRLPKGSVLRLGRQVRFDVKMIETEAGGPGKRA
jgi:hypothetical protein